MKFFLLLAIFCAVSYASVELDFKYNTGEPRYTFDVTEVTVKDPLVKTFGIITYNTMKICGSANTDLTTDGFAYEVAVETKAGAHYLYSTKNHRFRESKDVWAGFPFCFEFDFEVPQGFYPESSGFQVGVVLRYGISNLCNVSAKLSANW